LPSTWRATGDLRRQHELAVAGEAIPQIGHERMESLRPDMSSRLQQDLDGVGDRQTVDARPSRARFSPPVRAALAGACGWPPSGKGR